MIGSENLETDKDSESSEVEGIPTLLSVIAIYIAINIAMKISLRGKASVIFPLFWCRESDHSFYAGY